VAGFPAEAGAVLTHRRFEVSTANRPSVVFSLTINRVNAVTYMAVIEDVTLLVAQERLIFEDQQQFHAIFSHIRDYAIFVIDLAGLVQQWNESLDRMGGWQASDVEGKHLSMFSVHSSTEQVNQVLADAKNTGSRETEGWLRRRDGSQQWANTVITALPNAKGEVSGFVVVSRDMSERKRMEDELRRLATTDPLTGAHNRRSGTARMMEALAQRARYGGRLSLLMLDIDHFKSINDRYGHDAGDTVLCAFVETCIAVLRSSDVLIRWGGEEFIALLPSTDGAGAFALAERIRASTAAMQVETADGAPITFTVSIGVAEALGDDSHTFVQQADKALYTAKSNGRNRVAA
jgi:diguanylate cyclase (GGDEF)-like protein/PAS domain S-box-containing protein